MERIRESERVLSPGKEKSSEGFGSRERKEKEKGRVVRDSSVSGKSAKKITKSNFIGNERRQKCMGLIVIL
jgi:hypothetical protein